MNIVITGSRGFIGSHLVKHLKKEHTVIGLNKNPDKEATDYFCVDLSNISEVSRVFSNLINVDLIIHAASIADPKPTASKATKLWDVNTRSAINIREYYKGYLINLSSITVYGQFSSSYKKIESDECFPESFYSLSKLTSEKIFSLYGETTNLRLSAIVGTGLTHGALFDFQRRLSSNEDFYAIGKEPGTIKPYLYIDDLLSVIDLCIKMQPVGELNVIPDDKISILEMIIATQQALGIRKKIEWRPNLAWSGDNAIINASNEKLKALGWKPKYQSYEAILKSVVEEI